MRSSISAELLVLRKRTATWILLGVWTALGTFFAYVLPYTDDVAAARRGELLPEGLAGNLIGGFPFFGGVIALMLGVLAVGSDYGWDTVKTLFTQRPGRLHMLAAKLVALGAVLAVFVLSVFLAGAAASWVVAQLEDAAVDWPSAWLLVRTLGAGWLILAVWAALGVMVAALSRGTALAIGIGILYALVIEGLVTALVGQPLDAVFLRSNAYSLATALGTPAAAISDNGPGSFSGPFVDSWQALAVLAAYVTAFVAVTAAALRRRDVA